MSTSSIASASYEETVATSTHSLASKNQLVETTTTSGQNSASIATSSVEASPTENNLGSSETADPNFEVTTAQSSYENDEGDSPSSPVPPTDQSQREETTSPPAIEPVISLYKDLNKVSVLSWHNSRTKLRGNNSFFVHRRSNPKYFGGLNQRNYLCLLVSSFSKSKWRRPTTNHGWVWTLGYHPTTNKSNGFLRRFQCLHGLHHEYEHSNVKCHTRKCNRFFLWIFWFFWQRFSSSL